MPKSNAIARTGRTAALVSLMISTAWLAASCSGDGPTNGTPTGSVELDILEIYDPGSDAWTEGAVLPIPRSESVSAVFDGKLYIVGGLDYRKEAERKSQKNVLSEGEWYKQKNRTAKHYDNQTDNFGGTESPTTEPEPADDFTCESCPNAKENILEALGVLDHYGIPPEIGDMIQKWIEEKYVK